MKTIIQEGLIIECYDNITQLKTIAKHMLEQAEWAEKHDLKPPYLRTIRQTELMSQDKVDEILEDIKESFKTDDKN